MTNITKCGWKQNWEEGYYETLCGHLFTFIDGGPTENHMKFCCYCGKPIIQVEAPFDDENGTT